MPGCRSRRPTWPSTRCCTADRKRWPTGVWSAIGATEPPSYENSGHNNNLSFVVTDDGVLVVNAGDNYLLAHALHEEIKTITDQPVKYVVLENGQGHAAMGSAYWKEQGATIIAHADALAELQAHGERFWSACCAAHATRAWAPDWSCRTRPSRTAR